jgi:hypothetical protein
MAGLFGASAFPQAQVPVSSAPPKWATSLGLFGAALQDAGAGFSGRPTGQHLAQYQQLMQQQLAQQAIRDAASQDPAVRQRAYATLSGLGVNTEGLRQNAAAAAAPELLKNITGYDSNVGLPAVSAPLPGGGTINAPAIQSEGHVQGMPLGDAINATPSPELASQFAPQLITQAITQNTPKIENVGGHLVKYAPNATGPQDVQTLYDAPLKPNPNAPFNPDGTPNKAYQAYQESLIKARAASGASDMAGWTILNDPETNTPYRYNVRTGAATTLNGQAYTPQGATHVQSGQTRSAQTAAVQRYMQEHPRATADDIMQFAADFGATGKSVGAFSTGKQGDLIRSFNVGISHLNTLGGLVDALGNGDIQAFNKLGNAYAQQTGNPAPTNFDAAKAIVGDEIIKAIVGGGGALADRENAQNQINRANSPQQLLGVINTYKNLMAGQLGGLKKQYSDTTHRGNFDSRLSPEAKAELERDQKQTPQPPRTVPAGHIRVFNPATGRLE